MRYLRGLRVQILIWTILPLILILVAVSLGSIKLHQDTMHDMVAERNAHLAGLVAARLDDQIQMRVMVLETVLHSIREDEDPSQVLPCVGPVMEHFDLGIMVYDWENTPLTKVSAATLHSESEVQKVLRAAQETPGQMTYQLISATSSPRMVLMAISDPTTRRTAVGVISQQGLNRPDLLGHVNRSPRREVYVISAEGVVLYHQDEEEIGRDYEAHAGVQQALKGEAGATFDQPEGEDEHVVGYAPVQTTGWAVLIEEPWFDVIVPGLQYSLWAPILGSLGIGVVRSTYRGQARPNKR